LLRLASWAPSGNNLQAWFFVAIHSPEVRESVAKAIEEKLAEIRNWPEAEGYEEALRFPGRYPGFIRQAPWLIAFCQEEGVAPFEGILRRRGLPAEMIARWRPQAGLQSVSAAIQNFLLAAHGRGLGAVWMLGPLFAVTELEGLLQIHPPRRLVALVPLGHPAEEPVAKARKPVEETWSIIS
ncbi:MAG: nitroreductase family protein, partial [Coprothermobacterota bacterium]|nr:nitroreductase family protein [Coprothermobacterota bacterium]